MPSRIAASGCGVVSDEGSFSIWNAPLACGTHYAHEDGLPYSYSRKTGGCGVQGNSHSSFVQAQGQYWRPLRPFTRRFFARRVRLSLWQNSRFRSEEHTSELQSQSNL